MEKSRRNRRLVVLALLASAVVAAAAASRVESVRWASEIVFRKLTGRLSELTWGELFRMLRPRAGYNLKVVVTEGRSLGAAITNPFQSASEREHGAEVFRNTCSVCHGIDAKGGRAPSLVLPTLRHGNNDWSIYKVLRDGIAGTAMGPAGLEPTDAWRVIAFLRERQKAELAASGQSAGPDLGPATSVEVSPADLVNATNNGRDWLTYSRTLDGWRHSPLTQLTPANASKLRTVWVSQLETDELTVEATPLVTSGVMYLSEPPNGVLALDAKTGRKIWRHTADLPPKLSLCCGKVNRGLAILNRKVFLGTLDAHVVALDAGDGNVEWVKRIADPADGYSITAAPLAIADMVVVGISGGEFGIRGFIVALDAATGEEKWRFQTIPDPGEPGHQTWSGDSWKTGGGPTWVTGSYGAAEDTIYWGVGNPSPVYVGEQRLGDDLYTDSVVALDRATGKLRWYFQFTPHDERDWDSNQTPMLADLDIGGSVRHVLLTANRNGFYYVLDRSTGAFLSGSPFVKQTWAVGLDPKGRPIEAENGRPSHEGTLIFPGIGGGVNWQSSSFHPGMKRVFVPATEGGSVFSKSMPEQVHRNPGEVFVGSGSSMQRSTPVVRALEAATGQRVWDYLPTDVGGPVGGLLSTAGDLVFGSSSGTFFALDAKTGEELWKVPLGGATFAAPISFAIDEKQIVSVAVGRSVFAFGL